MTSMQLRIGLTATGGDMAASAMLSLRQNLDVNYYIHAFNSEFCQLSSSIADQFDVVPLDRLSLWCILPNKLRHLQL